MQDQLWDPERLRGIASILNRYSAHLQPGHKIRLGVEGDPCSSYRSADESPVATVTEVERRDDGYVSFAAQLDESGEVIQLDNRDIEKVWELHPSSENAFREAMEQQVTQTPPAIDVDEVKRDVVGSVQEIVQQVRAEHEEVMASHKELKEAYADAIHNLSKDIFLVYNKCPPVFAKEFVRMYEERHSFDESDPVFQGTKKEDTRKQSDKYDFLPEMRDTIV